MTEYVLRWLVRETWKPVAGRSVTVFNALSGSNSTPADGKWGTAELPGKGCVEGEVVGMARVEANAKLQNAETVHELIETVEERGEVVEWANGWDPSDDDGDAVAEAMEDAVQEKLDEAGDDENSVVMLDGPGDI